MTDPWLRFAVAVIGTAVTFAVFQAGQSVIAPVACALFIIAITWPMQRVLQSKLPKLLALAIVIVVVVVSFAIFMLLVAWAFGRVGRWLATDAAQLQALYDYVRDWLEGHGIAVAGLWSEHLNMRTIARTVQGVAGRINTIIGFWLVVVVYVILGLLEVDDMARRVGAMKNQTVSRAILDGSRESAAKLRRYFLIRTLMSLVTGALVWALAAAAGLQFAAEWGVLAFALNYIPFIGPFVATMFPTLFALAQFASWQTALVLFICLNVIQFVVGSYIEPRVAGRALGISPFIVLFAVFLWTFLWGLFGAFIGVPITIALLTYCAQHPSSRWLADLLGTADDESAAATPS